MRITSPFFRAADVEHAWERVDPVALAHVAVGHDQLGGPPVERLDRQQHHRLALVAVAAVLLVGDVAHDQVSLLFLLGGGGAGGGAEEERAGENRGEDRPRAGCPRRHGWTPVEKHGAASWVAGSASGPVRLYGILNNRRRRYLRRAAAGAVGDVPKRTRAVPSAEASTFAAGGAEDGGGPGDALGRGATARDHRRRHPPVRRTPGRGVDQPGTGRRGLRGLRRQGMFGENASAVFASGRVRARGGAGGALDHGRPALGPGGAAPAITTPSASTFACSQPLSRSTR